MGLGPMWGPQPFPYENDIKELVYPVGHTRIRATWDAQPFIGNTTGKWAVEQGKVATREYGNSNAGEAVRHETFEAQLASKHGEKAAKAIADAHEKYKSNDAQDSKRDQYNNRLGRDNAAPSQTREESLQKAKADWESGRAARDKFDSRIEKPSDTKSDTRTQKPPDASSVEQRAIKQGVGKAAKHSSNVIHSKPDPNSR